MQIQYVMVMVSDMQEAIAFYRDVLEFPLKFESPGWTEFSTEGATLALHPTKEPASADISVGESAGTVRFGFNVPDLDAYHEKLCAREVACVQEPKLQFGAKLAQYRGPDGLLFSVGEARQG